MSARTPTVGPTSSWTWKVTRLTTRAPTSCSTCLASYHGNAGGLSFADGHSETHKWGDGRTMPPLVAEGTVFDGTTGVGSAGNKDVGWLQDHSTRPTQ